MVVGLLPVGPIVINQGHKLYRPLRLLQTLCAGGAGGLGLDGCFLLIQSRLFVCFLKISSESYL